MKYWALFYNLQADNWVEVIADRSIIRLDGRLSRKNMHAVANYEAHRRGFDGFRLHRGNNLLTLTPLTENVEETKWNMKP